MHVALGYEDFSKHVTSFSSLNYFDYFFLRASLYKTVHTGMLLGPVRGANAPLPPRHALSRARSGSAPNL